MKCPICQIVIRNVQLHLRKMAECSDKIEMEHFTEIHKEYKKQIDRIRNKIKTQKYEM